MAVNWLEVGGHIPGPVMKKVEVLETVKELELSDDRQFTRL